MSALLQHSDFAGLVNEAFAFTVEGGQEEIEAELVEAKEGGSQSAPEAARKAFSLQFRLPPTTKLGQGIVNIRHAKIEEIALFLVPAFANDQGWYMEAFVN